ncbi:hypothetical protein CW751_11305 [Brumimicrobium salinarum]|uniref:Fibronectin type-III domain-containing protein n=1 Tax=Brumimicrobium salinarum TaxID=2058658 RepID=A0A2I0R1G0_9FLAO|nr:choice-of-anchor J domain-containing protein [Brumimicrobium salinarum]PKR80240.1 hypothetical protein CW751_11305 [Brumimicrobium salinarum]
MKRNLLIIPILSFLTILFGTSLRAQTYCVPQATNSNRYIDDFSTSNGVQNINNMGTGFSSNGYGDFTAQTLDVQIGESFTFNTTVVGGTAGFRIWIDWSQSGTFDVAYQSSTYESSHTGTITVPTGAAVGATRMRIVSHWLSSSGDVNTCETGFTYGEFEDYTFNILPAPSCLSPSNLSVSNLLSTSADLEWTERGTATTWNIELGAAGFTPTGTPTSAGVTSNPFNVTGLTPNTSYDFYVQADCGSGDESTWVGPFSFTTACAPLSIPFSENFASTSTTQNCWTVLDDNNDGDTWDMDYSSNSLSGDEVAAMNTDFNGGANDDYLISPTLTLTGNERLRFHYRVQSAGEPNDFQVLLSTSGIGSSNFTDTIMPLKEADNTTYEEEIIYLHSFTGDVNIAFHVPAGGLDGWRLYIDSVVVETSPSCPEPTDLSIQNIDATTVDLAWTENGSATTWNVEYGPAGFTPGTGTSVTTNPYSISGLTPETDYDFYVQADCGSGDVSTLSGPYSFTTLPTCPTPFDIIVLNQMSTAIEIGWTQQGSGATTWNIEYGEEGFVQGTGTVLTGITSNPYTVTGLNANTRYEFYVQADCGGNEQSDWSASSGSILTECLIYEANGFCEGFDIDNSPYIGCWRVRNSNLDGDNWQVSTANPNTGAYSAIFSPGFSNTGENDDYLITPELNMQGIEYMNFYYSVESASNPNGFQVLLSTSGSEVADFTDTLMHFNVYTNTNYLDTTIDLTGYTGTVYIAFHMPDSDPNADDMYIDDVCFGECIPTPVADFEKDLCRTDGTVNLMEDLYNFTNIYGEWIFPQNQASIEQDSLLNVDYVTSGSYDLTYIVQGLCQADTTIATINLYNASSAGRDSTITVCKEEPIDLLAGLGGTVDLGGTWIDYNNAPLSTSYPIAPQIPAQYNYYYVVANAACPADTALLVVNVDPTCTYVSVTEEEFEKISVHPNPATDLLNIVNPFNASALKAEMLDMNGRVVLFEDKALNNSTKATLAIDHLEKGVYTLRIYNGEGQRTFKVVKQ